MKNFELHPNLGAPARTFLAREHRMLINGEWIHSHGGKRMDVIDGVIVLSVQIDTSGTKMH